jgi:hypothetical protein
MLVRIRFVAHASPGDISTYMRALSHQDDTDLCANDIGESSKLSFMRCRSG